MLKEDKEERISSKELYDQLFKETDKWNRFEEFQF